MTDLTQKRCQPCEGGISALTLTESQAKLAQIPHWTLDKTGQSIYRHYQFPHFYATMAFVNALAWLAHQEDHHPDLEIGYNYCRVRYQTHALNGLSDNDFICAAKVNILTVE